MKAVHFVSTRAVLGDVHIFSMLNAAQSNVVLARGIKTEVQKRIDALSSDALPGQTVLLSRDVRDVMHKLTRAASRK